MTMTPEHAAFFADMFGRLTDNVGHALLGKALIYFCLRGDTGMIGAQYPARWTTLHTCTTNTRILNGIV